MLKKTFLTFVFALLGTLGAIAQSASQATDLVLVLPFENTSGKVEFNWVGESFADALSDLLKVPSLNVVSNEERKIIQQRLRVPLSTLPSLATSLKLARDSGATLLVSGRYTIVPAGTDTAATINLIRPRRRRRLSCADAWARPSTALPGCSRRARPAA